MSQHEDRSRLTHMLHHAVEAVEMTRGKVRVDLDRERTLNLALVRLLEIVGEAAGRIPKETRQHYPNIPWRDIVGLRNRLIQGYDEVDFDILWEIVREDLPKLITELQQILADASRP
jgi:uncharacterized protein with HEPN domain